jgi:hypothetical protein
VGLLLELLAFTQHRGVMTGDAEIRDVREAASHRESSLFEADRGAYWESLRGLGRVVRINPVINPAYQRRP